MVLSIAGRYAASIEKIDYDDEKVLIHYRQWSHRYDEWFDWASPYLRPVERIQLRREGLQDEGPTPVRAKLTQLPSSHTVCLEARFICFHFLSVSHVNGEEHLASQESSILCEG